MSTLNPAQTVKAKDLREGDIVRLTGTADRAYFCCTVQQVERERSGTYGATVDEVMASPIKQIHLIRPYIHADNFVYTGGVITYIGYEEFSLWPETEVELLEETSVPGAKREPAV